MTSPSPIVPYLSPPAACIANLPGVACCGHGDPAHRYVQFTDGRTLRGFTAEPRRS